MAGSLQQNFSQSLSQSQSLAMTPQLRQAIEILQYSNQELTEFIGDQLLENPFLEAPSLPDSGVWQGTSSSGSGSGDALTPWEERTSVEKTLPEHLRDQISLAFQSPMHRMIALHLVDAVDANGYLHTDLEHMAETLDIDLEELEDILAELQTFEPAGVFARSAEECLRLQLIDTNQLTAPLDVLLQNLPLLAKGDAKSLRTLCNVDADALTDMVAIIRGLNPRPGAEYAADTAAIVVPDILVVPISSLDGASNGWHIELNTDTLPRVLVNENFAAQVSQYGKHEKKYMRDRKQRADFLVKSLEQRAQNILKVATEIVHQQEEFFEKGVRYLKPMILKDVAEACDLHESTVSRVTSNKFMLTPRGTVPLKYFFTSSVTGITGDGVAATAVQDRIKSLIDGEGKKILSDDAIAAFLDEVGITIARRTVAKYREGMGIPSSVERRKRLRRL